MDSLEPMGRTAGHALPKSAHAHEPAHGPARPWVTRLLIPGALFAAFAALLVYAAGGALIPATEIRVVPVVVQSVPGTAAALPGTPDGREQVAVAQATGWVEPAPYPVLVNALADGVVQEILVLEGDPVETGQAVARLIDDDAVLALRRTEAMLARSEAQLGAARRRWENPIDRNLAVATAQAGVGEVEAQLAKQESVVEAAAAEFGEAEALFQLVEATRRRDASSEVEFVTARQRMAARRAALAAAQAERSVLEAQLKGRREQLAAAVEEARLRIEETRALATAQADLADAEAARDEARLRLERMTVRAPAAGVVMSRHVDVGSRLMLGMDDPLSGVVVRLFDPEKLQVRVDVPLADVAKVGVGMPAEVIVSVLPDRTFAGHVTRIVHEADVTRNTLQVKVSIDDPDVHLKPEMLARVKFFERMDPVVGVEREGNTRQAVFAPEALLVGEGDTRSVWLVDPAEEVAVLRRVTLGGGREEGWVEVTSGLMPGDRLIADPSGLDVGSRIRVIGEADAEISRGGHRGVH